jgi:RNA polymerase sigma-70 factor (ECF subfamily)
MANQRKLAHLCVKLCGNYHDGADLYQETVTKAFVKIDLYRPEQPFDRWVYAVCVNTFRSMERAKRRRVRTVDYATNEDKDHAMAGLAADDPEPESDPELRQALERLPERYKSAIVLHYLTGYKLEEIAKILGVPEGTVKNRLFRGRELLKRRLTER